MRSSHFRHSSTRLLPFSTLSAPHSSLQIQLPPHPILHLLQNARHHSPDQRIDLNALHSYSITSGLVRHPFAASRVVELCLRAASPGEKCRRVSAVFDSIDRPDVYTWNLMIGGLIGCSPEMGTSYGYYFRMRGSGVPPNGLTFGLLVKACMVGGCGGAGMGRVVHGQVLKCGVEDLLVVRNSLMGMYCGMGLLEDARLLFYNRVQLDTVSYNTMISGYGKIGDLGSARELFDIMPHRSLVSWSAMIDGYVRSCQYGEALRVFSDMQAEGLRPDVVILVSVLKACAHLGALDQGQWVHLFIDRNGMGGDANVVLGTALVDMYCKCGCVDAAVEVFDRVVHHGDVVMWNAMIGGLAMHGHAKDALDIFWRMRDCGIAPNETTFIGVLCACSHAGMVQDGIELFESMKKDHGLRPWREHYGCLADLLGRAGLVQEAEELLLNMPVEPQASQWGALMSACRTHNNIEVGERVGKHLISLEPEDAGRYVLLSNVYAAAGRQEDARETRRAMEDMGIKKETGCSFIECNGAVHEFIVGDTIHPQSIEIYVMLGEMERELEMVECSI